MFFLKIRKWPAWDVEKKLSIYNTSLQRTWKLQNKKSRIARNGDQRTLHNNRNFSAAHSVTRKKRKFIFAQFSFVNEELVFFSVFFFSVFSGKLRYALFWISQYIWCSAEVGQFQLWGSVFIFDVFLKNLTWLEDLSLFSFAKKWHRNHKINRVKGNLGNSAK